LGQTPSKAAAGTGAEYEKEAREDEVCLGRDHEYDPTKNEEYYANETKRRGLEAEKECEDEYKYQG
jgi:hypothetical protein